MSRINRENIADHLLDYQLGMIGKSMQEAHMTREWYSKWTMTQEQHDAFKAYAIPLLKKVFKINKTRAESTFQFFDLEFGLRIKNN
jgi:hypothetical protein